MKATIAVLYNLTESQKEAIRQACGEEAEAVFLEPFAQAGEIIKKADAILGFIGPGHIEEATGLKWAQTGYAGVEGVVEAARQKKIVLTNASGAYGEALSEFLLLYALAIEKRLPEYIELKKQHKWEFLGKTPTFYGSKAAVVGLGDIGKAFARKAKALGAYVTGVKRTLSEKPDYVDELYTEGDLDKAIDGADIIALCLPSTEGTRGIMTRDRIFAMKEGSILLNIGRGSAIDQEALIDALREKRIYCGLDVATPEPLPESSPLWDLDNAIITPHISGYASNDLTAPYIAALFARNIRAFLSGSPFESQVDLGFGY